MSGDPLDKARVELARFLNSEHISEVRRADDGYPIFTAALWDDTSRAPWPPADDAEDWRARLVSEVPVHSYAWWVRLLAFIADVGTPAFDPDDIAAAFSKDVEQIAWPGAEPESGP